MSNLGVMLGYLAAIHFVPLHQRVDDGSHPIHGYFVAVPTFNIIGRQRIHDIFGCNGPTLGGCSEKAHQTFPQRIIRSIRRTEVMFTILRIVRIVRGGGVSYR
jgi:hypothetical protein